MPEIVMHSSAFVHGGLLPIKYACDGENLSPPLNWSAVPEGTQSLTLVCSDPDAPQGPFIHWLIFNLPPHIDNLPAGIPTDERELADGAYQGLNSARTIGYHGPCPPHGETHRYVFTLCALDIALHLRGDVRLAEVLAAMQDHVLAKGEFMARYTRV